MSALDGRLIDEMTGGIAAPAGPEDALKLARVNAAGDNLEYIEATEAVAGDGSLAAALEPLLSPGLGATIRHGNVVAASIAGVVNNFSPAGWSAASANKLALTLTADATLTGLDASVFASVAGKEIEIEITAGDFTLTVPHSSGTSSAGNKFSCAGYVTNVFRVGDRFTVRHDEFGFWAVLTASVVHAARIRGVGLTVDSTSRLSPRLRPRKWQDQDQFISGGTATGTIGKLGWALSGVGTPAFQRISNRSLTSVRSGLVTSAAINDSAVLSLGAPANGGIMLASELDLVQFVFLPFPSAKTNRRIFFGLINDTTQNPLAATDCIGIAFDSGVDAANWLFIARAAGVGSPAIAGVSTAVGPGVLLSIVRTGSSYAFRLDNTLLGTIASGVPTATLNPAMKIQTLSAAAISFDIGSWNIEASPSGTHAADTFLEA